MPADPNPDCPVTYSAILWCCVGCFVPMTLCYLNAGCLTLECNSVLYVSLCTDCSRSLTMIQTTVDQSLFGHTKHWIMLLVTSLATSR